MNHDILLKKIKTLDTRAIFLIERAIKNYTVTTSGMKLENNEGVPQGIPISNLLAEIYVMQLDHEINKTVFFYKRYVDDTIIITKHKYLDLQKLKHKCNELKIELNNEKTKIVNIQNTISFLGYSLSKNKISVSKKSCENHFKRINSIFKRYSINVKNQNNNEKTIIEELTMLLAGAFSELKRYGWLPYYSMMTDIKILYKFDAFVIKKLKRYNYIHLQQNIPKMVRAYFALRDGTWNKYAFSFDNKTIAEKIEILQRRNLYPSDGRNLTEYEIDIIYKRFIKGKTQMLDFDLGRRY
ncbi:reverse transcriptase domain-containing protein [Desulfovibrio sp. ZJ369]|uniref:reverse transcriptase domain-containing protein n=1 Tax=Desulfovibrio sp. ZJ369 TaxID=2709793 RepID=UPI002404D121|nr:reverse transcriptase domain-containing protein [Desulfovibrio sp. ZJ369]